MKEIGHGSFAVVGFFISSTEWILLAQHLWRIYVLTMIHQTTRHHSRAIDRAVGHRPFKIQSRNKHQNILCGFYGGRSSTGTEGSLNTAFSFCQHHRTEILQSFVCLLSTQHNAYYKQRR